MWCYNSDKFWTGCCKTSRNQSPRNINTSEVERDDSLTDLTNALNQLKGLERFSVENNGYTLLFTPLNQQIGITIQDKRYHLQQFHFHWKSGHQLNGVRYDAEMHILFTPANTLLSEVLDAAVSSENLQGNLIGFGIFLQADSTTNQFLDLINTISKVKNHPSTINEINFNLSQLLPAQSSYFQYYGSLTMPPCYEGMEWIVFEHIVPISQFLLDAFQSTSIGTHNYRPEPNENWQWTPHAGVVKYKKVDSHL